MKKMLKSSAFYCDVIQKKREIINMKQEFFLIFLLFFVIISCSNPQDPTKSNFKKAIQDYYTSKQACFNVRADFPYQIAKSDYSYKKDSEIFNELVSIGFLTMTETEKECKAYFSTCPQKMEPAVTYSLTDSGKAASKEPEKGFLSLGGTDFCYGQYKVTEVTNFTEPANFMGQNVSEVDFNYKTENISTWAENSSILQSRFKKIARDIASSSKPIDDKAVLILTNKGWIHERLLNN